MSAYLGCVRIRQSVSVAVRAEADERDSQSQQTQEKCHHWRILGEIISKVGHRLQKTHNQTPHSPVFVKRRITSVTKVFTAFVYSTTKLPNNLKFQTYLWVSIPLFQYNDIHKRLNKREDLLAYVLRL